MDERHRREVSKRRRRVAMLNYTGLIQNISVAVSTVYVLCEITPSIFDPINILNGSFRKRNAIAYHLQYG